MLKNKPTISADVFTERFPNIAEWVQEFGWVEIGLDDNVPSMVRALDIGGMVWEGEATYPSLDAALEALEAGILAWRTEQGL